MPTDLDVSRCDAVDLAGLVRSGEVSAVELVETTLRRIEAANPELGAFVHVDGEAALARARALPERPPASLPLAGVPFAVKDIAGYPGMRWAMGSRLFAANVATEHSAYTGALDRAGLVTVGKTATSELGLLGSTETVLEGPTRNPWAPGTSATGSSGGAAAAVAAGLLPMAHASDGGGSIRVPASACGLFGFKPSNGRTPAAMATGGGFGDLLVEHCVSRSVRDSVLLLAATERTDDRAPHEPIGVVEDGPGGRLRIVVWRSTLLGGDPAPDVSAAVDTAASLCADLGHEVAEVAPPAVDGAAVSEAFFTLAGGAVDAVATMMAPLLGREPGPAELEPFTLDLLGWYREMPEAKRQHAPQLLATAARAFRSVFAHAEVALTSTLATPPWPLGHLAPTGGRTELVARTEEAVGYTPIHNIAGCPAMSVPLHWSSDGLPIGAHFAADVEEDARLLRLAYQLEAARPWRDRRPPHGQAGGTPTEPAYRIDPRP